MSTENHYQLLTQAELVGIFNRLVDVFYRVDMEGRIQLLSPSIYALLGYQPEEIIGRCITEFYWDPAERQHNLELFKQQQGRRAKVRTRLRHKDGHLVWVSVSGQYRLDEKGNILGGEGLARDITEQVAMEEKLRQQTEDHRQALKEIENQKEEIAEANTALRVLLKEQNRDREELKQQISLQIQKQVFPYLKMLHKTVLTEQQKECLEIIRTNLENLTGSLVQHLQNPILNLTPREILIADLIYQGKTTREMARLLGLSPRTVESYRNSLRKKLGLTQKKISLKSYLFTTFPRD